MRLDQVEVGWFVNRERPHRLKVEVEYVVNPRLMKAIDSLQVYRHRAGGRGWLVGDLTASLHRPVMSALAIVVLLGGFDTDALRY